MKYKKGSEYSSYHVRSSKSICLAAQADLDNSVGMYASPFDSPRGEIRNTF
jgi:hypothetical protein